LPFGIGAAEAKSAEAAGVEVNAWVVVKAGQHVRHPHRPLRDGAGKLTGLAQCREELECDW